MTADLACNDAVEGPGQTANLTTKFPLQAYTEVNINGSTTSNLPLGAGISQSAQLFVAWGSLSLIYGVVAIVVYMLFTANEQMQSIVDILVYAVSTLMSCSVRTNVKLPMYVYTLMLIIIRQFQSIHFLD